MRRSGSSEGVGSRAEGCLSEGTVCLSVMQLGTHSGAVSDGGFWSRREGEQELLLKLATPQIDASHLADTAATCLVALVSGALLLMARAVAK